MTAKLLSKYKQKIAAMELEPSRGGCFEVTANGKLIYSKLATGSFPNEDALVDEIGKLIG